MPQLIEHISWSYYGSPSGIVETHFAECRQKFKMSDKELIARYGRGDRSRNLAFRRKKSSTVSGWFLGPFSA